MENKLVDLHIGEEEEEVLRVEEIAGDHKPMDRGVSESAIDLLVLLGSSSRTTTQKLGHSDSFCPVRLQTDVDKLDLGWDISRRASRRKATTMESIGLHKENMEGLHSGSSHDWRDNRNINNLLFVNALGKVNPILGVNLEGDGAGF
ncbi:hypothetical protein Gogos_010257 [Gossypium gossypioides]|uniref:Uncharacterized protein n=1 Tax=Gossypium gossypioides TaxID=34282 RepID=A0A7J9BKT6_GOSGO|nr:hypothetical protein [Gossypium gossypioides]